MVKSYGTKVSGKKVHKLKRASKGGSNGDGDREVLTAGEPEQQELEGMETPRNPKLELKAKEIAARETKVKKFNAEIKELRDEALLIMHDFEIKHYHKYGVHLDIKSEEKLEVKVD